MDSFKLTVLGIALFLLLIIFIVVGVLMKYNNTSSIFPPNASHCPNYWMETAEGTCIIPVQTPSTIPGVNSIDPINVGSGVSATSSSKNSKGVPNYLTDGTTLGYNSTSGAIDFSNYKTCDKMNWSNKYGILWDGINNINTC